jgi:hypothetical protein
MPDDELDQNSPDTADSQPVHMVATLPRNTIEQKGLSTPQPNSTSAGECGSESQARKPAETAEIRVFGISDANSVPDSQRRLLRSQ